MAGKKRLDVLLTERGLAESRQNFSCSQVVNLQSEVYSGPVEVQNRKI